jgi:recombination protein RecA
MAKRGRPKKNTKEMAVSAKEIVKTHKIPPLKSKPPVEIISTGIDLFDLVLGGGFGIGKIVNLVGDKSSGKTLLAMEFIAYCRHVLGKKFRWFYDDAEAGFSFNSEQLYGFELIPANQICSSTIEEFAVNFKRHISSLRKGETFVYVLDSLDAMSSIEELKRDKEDTKKLEEAIDNEEDVGKIKLQGTYGMERQKKLSQFFRTRVSELRGKRVILIIISQVRTNINVMFGEKYIRTGGKALDFYASQIIWLAEVCKQRKKNRVTGITVKVRCKKNKLGKPFRECLLDIVFDYGADNVSSNVKFQFDLITPLGKEKERIDVSFDGQDFKSINQIIEYIEKNGYQKQLSELVRGKWHEIEDSISSKDRIAKWGRE